jgi:hypothetical protein
MLTPVVLPWVKERCVFAGNGVNGVEAISFSTIAMKTCQRQIIECPRAA